MYLDHLKSNNNAYAYDANACSFADCMEAALACTEVHSAADAYLIKAEAEYMVRSSEDGDKAAESSYWVKIKAAVRKMWETIKTLAAKVVSFVKSIPGKIADIVRKIITSFNTWGLKEKLAKARSEGYVRGEIKDVKYIDFEKINGAKFLSEANTARLDAEKLLKSNGSDQAMEAAEAEFKKHKEVFEEGIKEFREKINSDTSDWHISAKDMSLDEANKWCANLGDDKWKCVKTQYAMANQGAELVTRLADSAAKEFETAYKANNDNLIKKITKVLSLCRNCETMYATGANAFASGHIRWYYKMSFALKAVAASYKPKAAESGDKK